MQHSHLDRQGYASEHLGIAFHLSIQAAHLLPELRAVAAIASTLFVCSMAHQKYSCRRSVVLPLLLLASKQWLLAFTELPCWALGSSRQPQGCTDVEIHDCSSRIQEACRRTDGQSRSDKLQQALSPRSLQYSLCCLHVLHMLSDVSRTNCMLRVLADEDGLPTRCSRCLSISDRLALISIRRHSLLGANSQSSCTAEISALSCKNARHE